MLKLKRMKTIISAVMVLALAIISFAPCAALADNPIKVTVNGRYVSFSDQGPAIIDGRTLVPIRGVFEAIGFSVGWDNAAQKATLTGKDSVVILTIGDKTFTTNGESRSLDVPAQLIGGRTMLPIRAVLESVGYFVSWDAGTLTVIISSEPIPVSTNNEVAIYNAYLDAKMESIRDETRQYLIEDYHDDIDIRLFSKKLWDFDGNGIFEMYFEISGYLEDYYGFCTIIGGSVKELFFSGTGLGDGWSGLKTAYSKELSKHVLVHYSEGAAGAIGGQSYWFYGVNNKFYSMEKGELTLVDELDYTFESDYDFETDTHLGDTWAYTVNGAAVDMAAYAKALEKYTVPIESVHVIADPNPEGNYDYFHMFNWKE